jgi:hypothetical protein
MLPSASRCRSFLPVPIGGRSCRVTIKLSRWRGPDRWMRVSSQDEIVQMASKKQGASASAGSPIDFVLVHGSVRLAQDFISC